jgi:DNA-binding response OmpR family regulator
MRGLAEDHALEECQMTETTSISSRKDEDRQAFKRILPKRVEAFEERIRRYLNGGSDQASMLVLRFDVQRLAETSAFYNMTETRQHLRKLAQMLGDHIAKRNVPDPQQVARMLGLLSSVIESLERVPETTSSSGPSQTAHAAGVRSAASVSTHETAEPVEPIAPVETAEPVGPAESVEPTTIAGSAVRAEPVGLLEPDEPEDTSETGLRRIYHLSNGNAFAMELGWRLESEGYGLEQVEAVKELSELLACMLPQVLLVDDSCMPDLAAIGKLRHEAQQRARPQRHVHLVAMAAQSDIQTRRAAHHAGVDLLLVPPFDIDETVARLKALHPPAFEEKGRVLIVDDNRADSFYVQTVLNKAGMLAYVEHDPMRVLESLEVLHPDLVLMDLHMPFANGVEVTMLIRENPVYARLPIVFLSGESDPDSRLEAINAGGDDFLFKPIRPKHLIAAVRDRMRHMHRVGKQDPALGASDESTGG